MSEFWNNILTICGLIISIIGTIVSLIGLKVSLSSMKTAKDISDAVQKENKRITNTARANNFKLEIDKIINELNIYTIDMDVNKVKEILPKVSEPCRCIEDELTEKCLKRTEAFQKINKIQKNKYGNSVEMDNTQIEHTAKKILNEIISYLQMIKNS